MAIRVADSTFKGIIYYFGSSLPRLSSFLFPPAYHISSSSIFFFFSFFFFPLSCLSLLFPFYFFFPVLLPSFSHAALLSFFTSFSRARHCHGFTLTPIAQQHGKI
ncbi:hypothetical protein I3760_05G238500 [Carya illinoinensis]|nr:hypothetical protein I3760_05G238500 [Carya illinoinensis]